MMRTTLTGQLYMDILKKILASRKLPLLIMAYVIYAMLAELVFTNGTIRYRMTVRVETPEGIKEGSAVREIYMAQGIKLTPESHAVTRIKGESVVVDLGKRGQVFTTMSDDATYIIWRSFDPNRGGTSRKGIRYYRNLTKGKKALKPLEYPRMVTFKDPKDPMTIASVYKVSSKEVQLEGRHETQYFIIDQFEEQFGKGVKIKDVTIEITTDPVTYGIEEKWLPWLSEYRGKRLDGKRHGSSRSIHPLANNYSTGAFKIK